MRSYMTYELDAFRPWPELAIYVHGTAEVSYNWIGAQPYDLELHLLEVNDHEFKTQHVVSKDSALFKAIETALQANSLVWDACRDAHKI